MGNVCDAFCPNAKRHMAQSQDDAKLDLRVVDSHGAVTRFKMKKSTKFRKLLAAYAGKVGIIDPDTIRMMFDGQRVNLDQCPGDYDMESGDTIYCMARRPPLLGKTSIDGPILDRARAQIIISNKMAESSQDDLRLVLRVSGAYRGYGPFDETPLKVKRSTKFRKILAAFASKTGRTGINSDTVHMEVDGHP